MQRVCRCNNTIIKIVSISFLAAMASPCISAELAAPPPDRHIPTPFPASDGKIAIYNYHLDEVMETTYRRGDQYDPKALKEIQHIFRSRLDNKEHPIDIRLIELLDHFQDHFKADCIEIISGYRSPELNKKLKQEGKNVARESLHLKGKAADIHIDEITEQALAKYARSLKVGGVGYYPANDFVHVDTGEVKNWDVPDRSGRLLIALQKGREWQIITDKNIYLPEETIPYEIVNITRSPKSLDRVPILEIFRRGKWGEAGKLDNPKGAKLGAGEAWHSRWRPSKESPFGKYRIVIPGPEGFPHLEARSNEFYRKRM